MSRAKTKESRCEDCIHASVDYYEYFGGYKCHFIDGCKKDLEPHWDDEEESWECDEHDFGSGYPDEPDGDFQYHEMIGG